MADRRPSRLLELLTFGLVALLALRAPGFGDYPTDAGPALAAIAHGHVAAFFAHQPAMGAVSLLLRAPFTALAAGLGDGPVGLYRWGDLPCLLALAGLAIALTRVTLRRAGPLSAPSAVLAQILIAAVCLFNPLVDDALYWGHPEELLTTALAAGALLAACERRVLVTAVLAGLAVASKQWAIIALVPCALLLERDRLRMLTLAGATAVAATLPMAVANFTAFRHALAYISNPQPVVTVFTWLYPVSPTGWVHVSNIFGDDRLLHVHRLIAWEGAVSRPLITVLGLLVPAIVARWSQRPHVVEPILLGTAVAFVLRCALDPGSAAYYHLPILLVLLVGDAQAGRRIPVTGLIATALAFVVLDRIAGYVPEAGVSAAYVIASVLGCALLLARARGRLHRPVAAEPGETGEGPRHGRRVGLA